MYASQSLQKWLSNHALPASVLGLIKLLQPMRHNNGLSGERVIRERYLIHDDANLGDWLHAS